MGLLDDWLNWREGNRTSLLDATTAGADATLKALRQEPLNDAEREALVNTPAAWLGTDPMARAGKATTGLLNAALDMSPEARAARAAEQGFDIDAYHGTTSDIPAFNRIEGGNARGAGYYFSSSPNSASAYATGGPSTMRTAPAGNAAPNVLPVKLRTEGMFNEEATLTPAALGRIEKLLIGQGGDWKKGELKKSFDRAYPATGRNVLQMISHNAERQNEILQSAGYRGRFGPSLDAGRAASDYVMFNPHDIRSRFAAFDPARANDPDLLAAFTPAPLGGLLTPDDERRNR